MDYDDHVVSPLTLSWTNLFMSMKMRVKSERRGQLQMRALGGATAFGGETLLMDHLKRVTWMRRGGIGCIFGVCCAL